MKAIGFYAFLAALIALVLLAARVIPDDNSTTIREETRDLLRLAAAAGRWLWSIRPRTHRTRGRHWLPRRKEAKA